MLNKTHGAVWIISLFFFSHSLAQGSSAIEHNSFVLCVSRALQSPQRMWKQFKMLFLGAILSGNKAFANGLWEKQFLKISSWGSKMNYLALNFTAQDKIVNKNKTFFLQVEIIQRWNQTSDSDNGWAGRSAQRHVGTGELPDTSYITGDSWLSVGNQGLEKPWLLSRDNACSSRSWEGRARLPCGSHRSLCDLVLSFLMRWWRGRSRVCHILGTCSTTVPDPAVT